MNICDKNRIVILLKRMEEAHQSLLNDAEEGIYELCCICQETAVEIGNIIESNQHHGDNVIVLLEDYCELLYQTSTADQVERERAKLFFKLEKNLEEIRNQVNNIQIRKTEVLFIPYHAAMWDTFESIYREVLKDEDCHPVVMPIPYFNLGKGREIISEEYEGDRLPNEVKITNYNEYDISQKRPDVIFIHNPYDDFNTVTRVPEQYFSSELSKYTEHLVYIPYYLSESKISETMCYLPGVTNAWRVFVQSDTIREQYIKYNEAEKIVALGTPKTDMLFQKKDIILERLPIEWQEKLSGRTVFFYNTHLSSVMTNAESHIQKLEYMFDFFKQNDRLAIIWRPHPLIEETVKTYDHQILGKYNSMIKKFRDLNNGVYDDTSDLYRTIALADAYLGDASSSAATLFGATGKPMFYMDNTHVFYHKRLETIRTLSAVVTEDRIWQFSVEYNALFELDLRTQKNRYVTSFDEYVLADPILYLDCVQYKNKLFFIPCLADKLAVFHTDTEMTEYIDLEYIAHKDCNPVVCDNFLWLFPVYYADKLYVIDMDTHQVACKVSGYDQIFSDSRKILDVPLFYGRCVVGNQIWRACRIAPLVSMYDIKNETTVLFPVKSSNQFYRSITFDGKDFWILPMGTGSVVRWNREAGTVAEYQNYPDSVKLGDGMLFSHLIYGNGYVWLLPQECQRIIKIDIQTGNMEEIDYHTDNFVVDYQGAHALSSYFMNLHFLYLFPYQSNVLLKINVKNAQIEEIDNRLPQMCTNRAWIDELTHEQDRKNRTKNLSHVYREELCSLETFADKVEMDENLFVDERKDYFMGDNLNLDGTCGKRIWEYIKGELLRE